MDEQTEQERTGKRRAELLVAKLMESLNPTDAQREKFYPEINPALYSLHDYVIARNRILERDDYTCAYCGNSVDKTPGLQLAVDHIKPFIKGGSDKACNLVTACQFCNCSKCAKSLSVEQTEIITDGVKRRNKAHGIADNELFSALTAHRPKVRR